MKRFMAILLGGVLAMGAILTSGVRVWADAAPDRSDGVCEPDEVEVGLIGRDKATPDGDVYCKPIGAGGSDIFDLLGAVVDIFVILVGVLGVVGIVLSGIQYLTSGGDVGKMTKAKNRLLQVVIGLIVFGLFSAFLNFLIPGGLF